jgi:hypothetical protein
MSTVQSDDISNGRYVNELFLLLSAAIRLLRVLTFNLNMLALEAAQRRDVGPDTYPTGDLLSTVRGELWLQIVYDLRPNVNDQNGLH